MPVCAPAMTQDFGWSKADLGAVMGSFFWGYITTQVIGGYMADKLGGDKVLWMSGLVWGTLTFLTPFIAHFRFHQLSALALLGAARVVLGISQGVHYPSMMSLLGRKIPETERSMPVGIVTAAANFGSLLCGGAGSIILEYYGWERVFSVVGIVSLSWTYVIWMLSNQGTSRIISVDKMVYSQESFTPDMRSEDVPWKKIFSQSAIWAVFFTHFCNGNCFYVLLSWLPTYFHEHFPDEKGWVYNVIPWILSIPSSVFGGWMSDQLIKKNWGVGPTRKLMETIALGGVAFFCVILPFCTSFPGTLLCASMAISLQTLHNSAVMLSPQDMAPKFAGSVFGIMNVFGAFPGFLGVYITGYILSVSNSWTLVFFLTALLNCFGIAVFIIWGTGSRII